MRRSHKPGPKSRTFPRRSSCDLADATNNESFRSPTSDTDATNYNLEFTTQRTRSNRTLRELMTDGHGNSNNSTARTQRRASPACSPDRPTTSRHAARAQPSRRPRRRKQLTPASREMRFLRDVQRLQTYQGFLIPRLPFSRLVRELMLTFANELRITQEALQALQESCELYITQRLEDAYLLTLHRNRVTLSVKDLELINYLRRFEVQ